MNACRLDVVEKLRGPRRELVPGLDRYIRERVAEHGYEQARHGARS